MLERSLELVISLMGILKAGAPTCLWIRIIRTTDWRSCSAIGS